MTPSPAFARKHTNGAASGLVAATVFVAILTSSAIAHAQDASSSVQNPAPQPDDRSGGVVRLRLPTVIVTAQKQSEDVQQLPVSVTAVTADTLESDDIRTVNDAARFAPNTYFNEFSARKLSNARFRGIGSSPNNPGVTTYIDGVPQLNANSSSTELIDVNQVEFVRGPQSTLFGRNTLGGLVNITSARPSLSRWIGRLSGPFGNFDSGNVQGSASGPLLADRLALGVAFGYTGRDGFTKNSVTGHDLDSRSASFGKVQAFWTPAPDWEVRGILSGERARDGDYALNDLGALRANPFRAARDFEGFTHRDLVAPTLLVNRKGKAVDVSSVTGFVWWKTADLTDLDYTPLPLIRRANAEDDHQFTEELRIASSKNAAVLLAQDITLKWQAGVFFFTQNYSQDAVNSYSPFLLSPLISFPVDQHTPQSALDDHGVGVYGQGTLTFERKLDVIVGVRTDHENKKATLKTFFSPIIAAPVALDSERSFTDVSPQFTVAYHLQPEHLVYGSAARGFKAGGFNPASPPGSEGYGEEHTWNYEGGVKTSWLAQRLSANAAVFYINWRDMQVNVLNPLVPVQFYIANAGKSTSKGVELEVNARPIAGVDLFGGVGYTSARFGLGSTSGGFNVDGNRVSNMPEYTANIGVQYSYAVWPAATIRVRADVIRYGEIQYDDANSASQQPYALTDFRAGVHGARVFAEGWVRNAFDTHYVPTAFSYPGLAPSGFVGENGAPRTFGVRAGVTF